MGIFVLQGESIVPLHEQPYDSEAVLQELLARHPALLAGDLISDAPLSWLLIKREVGVPAEEGGGSRWSLDHLFIDQNAVPTLVEVKRGDDTRIRREVVGQMLDYAANGVVYWPGERLRGDFQSRCAAEGRDPNDVFAESLGENIDPDGYWELVEQNLRAGKVRLVFVADEIPSELRRVIEFLNERMTPTEVLGIEVKQYAGESELRTLVPRVVGQTEQARAHKGGGTSREFVDADWAYYETAFSATHFAVVRQLYQRMEAAVAMLDAPLTPVLRRGHLGFQREGQYHVIGLGLPRTRPVQLWVKLPESPQELRGRGYDVPDLYPDLTSEWDAKHKQWTWEIPSTTVIPDPTPALELSLRFQPASGPMRRPQS
jgi:hypothetical protein